MKKQNTVKCLLTHRHSVESESFEVCPVDDRGAVFFREEDLHEALKTLKIEKIKVSKEYRGLFHEFNESRLWMTINVYRSLF